MTLRQLPARLGQVINNNLIGDELGVSELRHTSETALAASSRENDDQPLDCGVYSNRPDCVLVSFHLELLHKVKDLK